jgi:hypothetical protein
MPVLTKKRLVLFALFAALVLVLVVAWGIIPSIRSLPDGMTVEAIETAYPELITRLVTQAVSGGGLSTQQIGQDSSLVAPPEILRARVGRNNGYTLVGKKHFDGSTVFIFPRQPRVGRPVLNKYWGTLSDGRKLTIVTYEAKVLDPSGREWEILIDFDLDALEQRLNPFKWVRDG